MFDEKKRPYRTFVLRCWQAEGDGESVVGEWRYTVQEIPNGEYRKAFTSLGTLTADLKMELERGACEPSDQSDRTARERGCAPS